MKLLGAALALLVGCGDGGGWRWDLPPELPEPRVPEDNPMSRPKVELGRHLFYDVRLSGNETQACASCHVQHLAFTDGGTVSTGSTDEGQEPPEVTSGKSPPSGVDSEGFREGRPGRMTGCGGLPCGPKRTWWTLSVPSLPPRQGRWRRCRGTVRTH